MEPELLKECTDDTKYEYYLMKIELETMLLNHTKAIEVIKTILVPLTASDIAKSKHVEFILAKTYSEGSWFAPAYYSLMDICSDTSYDLEDYISAHLIIANLHSNLTLFEKSKEYVEKAKEIIKSNSEKLDNLLLYYELKCIFTEAKMYPGGVLDTR